MGRVHGESIKETSLDKPLNLLSFLISKFCRMFSPKYWASYFIALLVCSSHFNVGVNGKTLNDISIGHKNASAARVWLELAKTHFKYTNVLNKSDVLFIPACFLSNSLLLKTKDKDFKFCPCPATIAAIIGAIGGFLGILEWFGNDTDEREETRAESMERREEAQE